MTLQPKTRYAKTPDGLSIAYQVVGTGPADLLSFGGFGSIEAVWEVGFTARYFEALASFSRLILHDPRGMGLSDPPDGPLTLESWAEDARSVMDAAGSARAVLKGSMQSGAVASLLAAAHPERVTGLVWYLPTPRHAWAPDYPWGQRPEQRTTEDAAVAADWGGDAPVHTYYERDNPSLAADPGLAAQIAKLMRQETSPRMALEVTRLLWEIDVRLVLPTLNVPALVIDRDETVPEEGEYAASLIPGCRRVVLPGRDCLEFLGDWRSVIDAIRDFAGVSPPAPEPDRRLLTVLFTDIVGSTAAACDIGDARWKALLQRHDAATRQALARFGGCEVKTTGDGFLASFERPALAVRCAQAICVAARELGVEMRAGCHTGEVELTHGDLSGVAVHIGARIAALAGPSEVLVSSTVRDLVTGSGLAFEDRGEHVLKGVPDTWRLFRVAPTIDR